jgi:hypothetical protein
MALPSATIPRTRLRRSTGPARATGDTPRRTPETGMTLPYP